MVHVKLLVFADDDNLLGENIRTIKTNTCALLATSKETGLEVNADKTKNMVMSCEQNARQNHTIWIGNKSFKWWQS
jgi:hypothetical protein